jgi:hypothetical protein
MNSAQQIGEIGFFRQIMAPRIHNLAKQRNFFGTPGHNPANFFHNLIEWPAAFAPAPQWDDTKGTIHIAAILNRHMHRNWRVRPIGHRQRWRIEFIELVERIGGQGNHFIDSRWRDEVIYDWQLLFEYGIVLRANHAAPQNDGGIGEIAFDALQIAEFANNAFFGRSPHAT